MGEADRILARAKARAQFQADRRVPIDYVAMNAMVTRQRAALTRAINSGKADKVVVACRNAVREWNRPGMAWPDDWSRWQRALDDALPLRDRVILEDLS